TAGSNIDHATLGSNRAPTVNHIVPGRIFWRGSGAIGRGRREVQIFVYRTQHLMVGAGGQVNGVPTGRRQNRLANGGIATGATADAHHIGLGHSRRLAHHHRCQKKANKKDKNNKPDGSKLPHWHTISKREVHRYLLLNTPLPGTTRPRYVTS